MADFPKINKVIRHASRHEAAKFNRKEVELYQPHSKL